MFKKAKIFDFDYAINGEIKTVCKMISDEDEEPIMIGSDVCQNFCKYNLMTDQVKNKVLCNCENKREQQ